MRHGIFYAFARTIVSVTVQKPWGLKSQYDFLCRANPDFLGEYNFTYILILHWWSVLCIKESVLLSQSNLNQW